MNHADTLVLVRELGPTIKEMIAEAVAPLPVLAARMAAVEARPHFAGARRGEGGLVFFMLSDGSTVDLEIRNGIDGKDGAPGPAGPAGEQGEQGERGEKGDRGEPGQPGDRGEPGAEGKAGADAVGFKTPLLNEAGELILTRDDGEVFLVGRVRGDDGKDGAPGIDGAAAALPDPGISPDLVPADDLADEIVKTVALCTGRGAEPPASSPAVVQYLNGWPEQANAKRATRKKTITGPHGRVIGTIEEE